LYYLPDSVLFSHYAQPTFLCHETRVDKTTGGITPQQRKTASLVRMYVNCLGYN